MSSIAYITDKKMIEYHRLNGNKHINFWRPTTQKSFMKFSEGDYLFFLAKGTEKGQSREKGIIGYGRLTKERNLDFKTMWRIYKQKNGYDNKEELYEAIMKITKHHAMPDYLNCLELSNIMFFQTPIYLSELDIQLSKQVESYVYLDQEDIYTSMRIIEKAESFGQDMWSSIIFNNANHSYFQIDAITTIIQNVHQYMPQHEYSHYEVKKIKKILNEYQDHKEYQTMARGQVEFIDIEAELIMIPCLTSIHDFPHHFQKVLGRYSLYKAVFAESKYCTIEISILFEQEPTTFVKLILKNLLISYKIGK